MAEFRFVVGECFLGGHSLIYLWFDYKTLEIIRFEIRGDTKAKLSLTLAEDSLNEEVKVEGKVNQGREIQVVDIPGKWKMIKDKTGPDELIKMPPRIRIQATWELT